MLWRMLIIIWNYPFNQCARCSNRARYGGLQVLLQLVVAQFVIEDRERSNPAFKATVPAAAAAGRRVSLGPASSDRLRCRRVDAACS